MKLCMSFSEDNRFVRLVSLWRKLTFSIYYSFRSGKGSGIFKVNIIEKAGEGFRMLVLKIIDLKD